MNIEHFNEFIIKIANFEITSEEIIGTLNNFKNPLANNENDIRFYRDFLSYFTSLLHDEGNKYITIANNKTNLQQQDQLNAIIEENVKINQIEKRFTDINITDDTPLKSGHKQKKKISLQPLNNSPIHGNTSLTNIDTPNQRRSFSSTPNHNNASPRQCYSSKISSKPTLFDFISPPIKSPNQMKTIKMIKTRPVFKSDETKLNQEKITPSIDGDLIKSKSESLKTEENLGIIVRNSLSKANIKKLKNLSKLYTDMILNNIIFSLNTELFFLFQLLTLNSLEDNQSNNSESKNLKIFTSLESCIYFAVNSISLLECIIKYFKSSTIVELKHNVYIKTFSELFPEDSFILNHELCKDELKSKSRLMFFELKQVPFHADTHVRDNFPGKTDVLFYAFKNQRDTFYDILSDWEKNHKAENWNFADMHGKRIKELISSENNSTNCLCLVKLFQDQFILMCKHDKMLLDIKDDEIDGPKSIKASTDLLRLKRLYARMSMPHSNNNTNSNQALFTGYQEFFRDFILIADSPIFNQLLKDSLSIEVFKINDDAANIVEENENSINNDLIEDMILRMRIIGKFLGFLVFLPYLSVFIPSYLIRDLSLSRNSSFPINLRKLLENALKKSHLILTIPFVIEFLNMMDEYALSIQIIHDTFSILVYIFQIENMSLIKDTNTNSKLLILFSIAWLLQSKKISNELFHIDENIKLLQKSKKHGLDDLNIINPLLLHHCCPYLDDLSKILTRFSSGIKRTFHQINKTNAFELEVIKDKPRLTNDYSYIQNQLEAQFFHSNPNLKKIIDYVTERVIMNFLKDFKNKKLKLHIAKVKNELANDSSIDYQEDIETRIIELSRLLSKELVEKCLDMSKEYFISKITDLVTLSVDESISQELINLTCSISNKLVTNKLNDWIKINLNEEKVMEELQSKKQSNEKSIVINLNTTNIDMDQTRLLNATYTNFKDDLTSFTLDNEIFLSNLLNEMKKLMKDLIMQKHVELKFVENSFKKVSSILENCVWSIFNLYLVKQEISKKGKN